MAKRHERAALRLAHRSAAMSAVWRPATMKKTTGRPLFYVLLDHDTSRNPWAVLNYPNDECQEKEEKEEETDLSHQMDSILVSRDREKDHPDNEIEVTDGESLLARHLSVRSATTTP
ncbi:hypothetical protein G5I_04031 [Acromyrmex echinatior]|uniref:Uncharacterized protein n=1 Tax=Acromyrmex echinatior TaxID=103372 RepID=F4WEM5_ACREC|nr:hypothetical protein G5I_04031 [Acromyrmex echinatior]